jgi:hypothetical protein
MNRFELRLKNIESTPFHGPVIDVMDTFDTVVRGLEVFAPDNWTAADAVRLTELVLARVDSTAKQE